MFDFFKGKASERPDDIKGIRHALLRFVKDELQKAEGGEGSYIKGLLLFITAPDEDKHLYEAAVYAEEPDRFKEEIQKIADDYALGLPDSWTLEIDAENDCPPEAVKAPHLDAALFIKTNKHFIQHTATAYIRVLNGEAVQQEYTLTSGIKKVNIGRDKKAQAADGFFRTNQIAFPSEAAHPANKYISRQHAHVEWNNEAACFVLYADEGGVPPRNKIKIRPAGGDEPVKLHSAEIGHHLAEGDQIILGESAVIEFSYHSEPV
ncbi:FHA domain-containing protein [Mucilaginibacter sp.]